MDFQFSTEDEALKQLAQKVFAARREAWLDELERAGLLEPETLGAWELALVLEQAGRQAASTDIAALLVGGQLARGAALSVGGSLVPERAAKIAAVQQNGVFLVEAGKRERQLCTDDTTRFAVAVEGGARLADAEPVLQKWTVALCALELGIAQKQLELTAEHLFRRKQFGKPIGMFQAAAQRAADAYIDVESLKLVTWQAAWRLADGRPAARELAIAAYFASDAGARVALAAQHLHAGIGFDRGYPLYRYFLAAKQIELELGGAHQRLAQLGEMI